MKQRTRRMTHAAIIAALYVVLTHLQNLLLPGSASWAIQCRISEVLCILACVTPAAIPGLTVGCLLFNITFAAALPLDWFLGSLATFLATSVMYLTRRITFRGVPMAAFCMPALFNAPLVGWELSVYIGGAFFLNAAYVALGEAIVLYVLGMPLFLFLRNHHLDTRLFC